MMATVIMELAGSRDRSPQTVRQTRVLIVHLDGGETNSPRAAEHNCGVSPGDTHPESSALYARLFKVTPWNFPAKQRHYQVEVTYQTLVPGEIHGDPVLEDPEISFGERVVTIAAVKDKDGDAILNSAHDPFAPPYEIEEHPLVIGISRNEATVDGATIRQYRDSVNSGSITVAGYALSARQGLLRTWTASRFRRHGYVRWNHQYSIEVSDGTWDVELLDQGLYYFDTANEKRRFKIEGEPSEESQRLDGSGGPLAFGAAASASQYLSFRIRKELSWSALSLPATV